MGAAPHPDAHGRRGRHGVPAGQDQGQQDELRLLRPDEHLIRLAAALLLVAGAAAAQESVSFESRDADLSGGQRTQLQGYFFRPAGPGPFPAFVLHHGCGGLLQRGAIGVREAWWAKHLQGLGVAALVVDGFSPRELRSVCGDRAASRAVLPKRARDSYGALFWLQARSDVRPDRVAVMGFSHGGSTALNTVSFETAPGSAAERAQPGFALAIAFYPGCAGRERQTFHRPLHILIGEQDDWTPAAPCIALADRLRSAGAPVELVLYAGAYHQFDHPRQPHRVLADIPNASGGLGVTIATDEAARADAIRRIGVLVAGLQK